MLPKYKDIMDLVKKGATVEAQEKIMELREAAILLQDENHDLKELVRSLKEQLETKGKMNWEKPFYWLKDGDDKNGPFCQVCWDKDDKQIRLQGGENGTWDCGVCKSVVFEKNYKKTVNRSPGSWMTT